MSIKNSEWLKTQYFSKDGIMDMPLPSVGNRRGQFLWMEPTARSRYVENLKKKITEGYYYSDNVVSKVVEEIAPILDEIATSR
jgi:hypothetical protein